MCSAETKQKRYYEKTHEKDLVNFKVGFQYTMHAPFFIRYYFLELKKTKNKRWGKYYRYLDFT